MEHMNPKKMTERTRHMKSSKIQAINEEDIFLEMK